MLTSYLPQGSGYFFLAIQPCALHPAVWQEKNPTPELFISYIYISEYMGLEKSTSNFNLLDLPRAVISVMKARVIWRLNNCSIAILPAALGNN
jgi:hypothetical protein